MCTTLEMVAMAGVVASTAMSTVSTMAKQGDNSSLYIQNGEAANIALANTYNANQTKAIQEGDKAATESFDVIRGLAEAKGKAVAAGGEAGVEGVSFANIVSDFEAREGRARGNIDGNYQMALGQVQNDNEAARSRAKGQINSVPRPDATGMYASVGADLFKAGLKIYDIAGPEKGKAKPGTNGTP